MKIQRDSGGFSFLSRTSVGIAVGLSTVLLLTSLVSIATRGLNLGLDFTGGAIVEFASSTPVSPDTVRAALAARGFDAATAQIADGGRTVIVRLPPSSVPDTNASDAIAGVLPQAELKRLDYVGPQVGDELREDGGLAMVYATGGIVLYLVQRFNWRFSLGATIATVHDAIIAVGCFSLFGLPFDLTIVAAVLTIMGYSLNDTIVMFDRVRENARRQPPYAPLDLFNLSINQTLSRTLITSGTTLIVVISMYLLGGETLAGFALALLVGIVCGTYSTLYIASPVTLALGYLGASERQPTVAGPAGVELP